MPQAKLLMMQDEPLNPGRLDPTLEGTSAPLLLGRYALERRLGGSMAEVYRAFDTRQQRVCAIKVLPRGRRHDRRLIDRLLEEARLLERIDHPHVVSHYETHAESELGPFFTMEHLEGQTLGQLLAKRGALPAWEALEYIRQAAFGLQAAHALGVVHRDVKPDNLFLCSAPRAAATALAASALAEPPATPPPSHVKVVDFGLGLDLTEPTGNMEPSVMGTAEYMAPEQVVADPVDARTDVYGLGMVLFRALTLELPFDAVPMRELLGHQLASSSPPPSWLADVSEALDQVLLTSVRKNPANRYPTMAALLADVQRVDNGQAPMGVPLSQVPDRYEPATTLGRDAFQILTRYHRALTLQSETA